MNIFYKHLTRHIPSNPSIEDLSEKLFQLGHEHEINKNIFDIEHTPNRGDCLSVNGLLRDLSVFYEIKDDFDYYEGKIDKFEFNFKNEAPSICPKVSFLKIKIDKVPDTYNGYLHSYFEDFGIKKNNFFTDISNYLAYEIGQPTHCYDANKINDQIIFKEIDSDKSFNTLFDQKLNLNGKNPVFLSDDKVINLAGVMGGASTACDKETSEVIIECAYFNPENIIGQSIKYGISSDAAYKFERHVDPSNHDLVLRRFIELVKDNTNIIEMSIFNREYKKINEKILPFEGTKINKILGTNFKDEYLYGILEKLNFDIEEKFLKVPSYRSDIKSMNDIAEEIARVVGYNNLPTKDINLPKLNLRENMLEKKIKGYLVDNGFFEIINFPFEDSHGERAIKVDNPLDINKGKLRTNLKNSLLDKLIYNEKRQKDSIKFFEISNIYDASDDEINVTKNIGIICSGRVGKNYNNFSKKIDKKYLTNLFKNFMAVDDYEIQTINRKDIDSKSTSEIYFFEAPLENIDKKILDYDVNFLPPENFINYKKISDLPYSIRDLSFSITNYNNLKILENTVINFRHKKLLETFVFDYFVNKKAEVIKIGFRFIFQSTVETITDNEVDKIMEEIICATENIESVSIPGLQK